MGKGLMGRSVVGTLVGLGLVVAGCGSSSSGSTSTTSRPAGLTKAQYLAQGNAICKQGQAAQQAAIAAYAKKNRLNLNAQPTNAQITKLGDAVLIPSIQRQIDAIKALSPPSGDQQTVSAMLATTQQDLDKAKKNPVLLAGNVFSPAAKMLHAYGLTSCARNR